MIFRGIVASSMIRIGMVEPPSIGRSGKPVPTTPDSAGPSEMSPDAKAALICGNRAQCDAVGRILHAWHACQGFESRAREVNGGANAHFTEARDRAAMLQA